MELSERLFPFNMRKKNDKLEQMVEKQLKMIWPIYKENPKT
jgi:hypothetical protein